MVEQCLADTARATPLRYLAFRYFNAAGATPGRPERHNPETHLIPNVMRAARGEGGPLRVFGSDFDTHDGTAVRDYVHVADLAEAHRLGLEYLRVGGPSETLNLGTGRGHSVLDVVRAVERVTGRAVPVQHAPQRQGDPPRLIALADRAVSVLGWRPQVTALEDIVRSVARYG
jgi:UDP-glucose 4-epimerase